MHGETPNAVETLLDEGCGEGAAQAPPSGVRVNVEPAQAQGGTPVVWQGLVGQAADAKAALAGFEGADGWKAALMELADFAVWRRM